MGKSVDNHAFFRSSTLTGVLLMLLAPVGSHVCAQDRGNPNWHAKAVPYFWLSNVDGSQVMGDFHVPVADSVLLPDLALRFEAGKGRLRGIVHLFSSHRDNSTITNSVGDPADSAVASYSFSWFTADLLAAVQIGPFVPEHAVELYAGARYMRHRQQLEFTENPSGATSTTESWIDPVVGTRLYIELSRHFWTTISTDIGGFGIGSDLIWSREAELGFRVIRFADVTVRYTHLQVQFDNEKVGSDRYAWDGGVIQGWLFGFVFKI